ncbi:MAG: hypothetical protein ACFFAL_06945 [Promethearchaeota archaeon]
MIKNENKVKRKVRLKRVNIKPREVRLPKEMLEKAGEVVAQRQEPDLSADQQAILFVCERGHQSFVSILQGVNSTRIPIGKPPLDERTVRSLLLELEKEGYLAKAEIHDQPTWTATEKARALET